MFNFFGNRTIRLLAITALAACSPKGADTGTDGSTGNNTTEPASTSTSTDTDTGTDTGEPTGTSTAATDTTGPTSTTTLGTTTFDTSTSTGPASATDSESESDGESDSSNHCASTCGVSIECEHPDVDESMGAAPCEEGFHCVDESDCGCSVTFCQQNCDPEKPNACPNNQVCDPRSGACVPA
ncbi:hypothetical protein [Nannocystis pusilla]|uniref:hypothetical protein n=1 Tax=Nannocystis pusilla TaxID=889268 RepID=UPI003BF17019